jgi:hypothetical protein
MISVSQQHQRYANLLLLFLYVFFWLLFVQTKLPQAHQWQIRKTINKLNGLNINQPEKNNTKRNIVFKNY